MQRVKRVNANISPILDDVDVAYSLFSDRDYVGGIVKPVFDKSFKELFNIFDIYGDINYLDKVAFDKKSYVGIGTVPNNNLILCFSGGKDSIASALKYKEMGYNIYLYYMKHVNQSLGDEWKCAIECADELKLPLYFDEISLIGHHCWMEHPMKNMLIANGALSYGIRNHIGTHIAFGNYKTSELWENAFDRCAGDCVDMWEAYEDIVSRIIPNFKIDINLENMGETLDIVCDKPNILNRSVSCLCRHSLRQYRHDWVLNKFGVDLPQHRCGSCYKCAVEYIYMADHRLIEFNEDYYKYCVGQLSKVMTAEEVPFGSAVTVWRSYEFYDIKQSLIYQDLVSAKVVNGRIKW